MPKSKVTAESSLFLAVEDIKSEVIRELKEQNKELWISQERLLIGLIDATEALKIYRMKQLRIARASIDDNSKCLPECKQHEWDFVKGWVRK